MVAGVVQEDGGRGEGCKGHQGRLGGLQDAIPQQGCMFAEVSLLVPSGAQGRRLEWAHSLLQLFFISYIICKKSHFER